MIRASIAAIAVFLTASMTPTLSSAAEIKLLAARAQSYRSESSAIYVQLDLAYF